MKFILLAHTDVPRTTVYRGMPQFPGRLVEFLGDRAPLSLAMAGNPELLSAVDSGQTRSVALAASVESPVGAADASCDMVRALARAGAVFMGGFHSPLERRCLGQLIEAECPAIVCLGRTLTGFRVPHAWVRRLREGQLVLVSACASSQKRATRSSVQVRNQVVVALADCFVIPHATVEGKTEALCREVLKAGKAVWTLNHAGTQNLVALGARPATASTVAEILNSRPDHRTASAQLGD